LIGRVRTRDGDTPGLLSVSTPTPSSGTKHTSALLNIVRDSVWCHRGVSKPRSFVVLRVRPG
jgi:hypothetical protein